LIVAAFVSLLSCAATGGNVAAPNSTANATSILVREKVPFLAACEVFNETVTQSKKLKYFAGAHHTAQISLLSAVFMTTARRQAASSEIDQTIK